MVLKPPSHSNLIFALSTLTKLSICIKHSHWVMHPLLHQSLRASQGNHDSDAKEHLHITWPLPKAAQHVQGWPAVVLDKRFGKRPEQRCLLEPLAFEETGVLSFCCCDFQMEDFTERSSFPFAVLPCGRAEIGAVDYSLAQALFHWSPLASPPLSWETSFLVS